MAPISSAEGERIEDESLHYIDARISFPYPEREIVKRVVHTTADFSFAESIVFKGDAVRVGVETIKRGRNVLTDVKMVAVGVNSMGLAKFGGVVKCFVDDENTRALASRENITRSRAAFRAHVDEIPGNIVAVGNAPTALFELCEAVETECEPALVIATPVGFVDAREAKERILELAVPCIVVRGERGGSPIAASIVNALINLSMV
jgi:precorrin-8X/cobalt-precorrin-8 methylmutase